MFVKCFIVSSSVSRRIFNIFNRLFFNIHVLVLVLSIICNCFFSKIFRFIYRTCAIQFHLLRFISILFTKILFNFFLQFDCFDWLPLPTNIFSFNSCLSGFYSNISFSLSWFFNTNFSDIIILSILILIMGNLLKLILFICVYLLCLD